MDMLPLKRYICISKSNFKSIKKNLNIKILPEPNINLNIDSLSI